MCARGCLDSSADEVNLVALNVFNNHDFLFSQEMKCQVRHGFSQNTLLKQEHVCAGRDDLLNQVENVFFLLFEQTIHSSVVVHYDVAFEIGLWGR